MAKYMKAFQKKKTLMVYIQYSGYVLIPIEMSN